MITMIAVVIAFLLTAAAFARFRAARWLDDRAHARWTAGLPPVPVQEVRQ